jgi:hypothetical protein
LNVKECNVSDAEIHRQQLKIALGETAGCIPVDELASWLDQSLSQPKSSAVEAHLKTCAHCQTELSLLREFESSQPEPEEAAAVSWIVGEVERRSSEILGHGHAVEKGSWWAGWLRMPRAPLRMPSVRVLSLAAASLVVVITAGIYMRRLGEPALSPGGLPGVEVYRSHQLIAVSPLGQVTEPPSRLQWEPARDAKKYDVRLTEVDRTEVWKADSSVTSIEIPSNIRAKMAPGRAFLWEAVARNQAGEQIASTGLQRFQILAGK